MKEDSLMGDEFWSEGDKSMVSVVMGSQAFQYLLTSAVSSEGLVTAVGGDPNLSQKISELVDRPNGWNYAIFWQISRSKSGELVLCWGDGHCREPKDGEESEAGVRLNYVHEEDEYEQNMRKMVLQKLHTCFGGAEEDNYVQTLDRVTGMEMFLLTSMYFSFMQGEGAHGKAYGSGTRDLHLIITVVQLINPRPRSCHKRAKDSLPEARTHNTAIRSPHATPRSPHATQSWS
ncbi:hypothetical protein ACHQM5_000157 [Ranunculus cassubicifolius]